MCSDGLDQSEFSIRTLVQLMIPSLLISKANPSACPPCSLLNVPARPLTMIASVLLSTTKNTPPYNNLTNNEMMCLYFVMGWNTILRPRSASSVCTFCLLISPLVLPSWSTKNRFFVVSAMICLLDSKVRFGVATASSITLAKPNHTRKCYPGPCAQRWYFVQHQHLASGANVSPTHTFLLQSRTVGVVCTVDDPSRRPVDVSQLSRSLTPTPHSAAPLASLR